MKLYKKCYHSDTSDGYRIGFGSTTDVSGTENSVKHKPSELKAAIYNPRWSIILTMRFRLTLPTNAHRDQHNTVTKLLAIGMIKIRCM